MIQSPEERAAFWREAIERSLLGWLYPRRMRHATSSPVTSNLDQVPPVLRWWLFEGKTHGLLGGKPIAMAWDMLFREVRKLDQYFHTEDVWSTLPTGEVDWPATVRRISVPTQYKILHSNAGLSVPELEVLRGWWMWLTFHWREHQQTWGNVLLSDWVGNAVPSILPFSNQLFPSELSLRWAMVARRSSFALLRTVVADTIQAAQFPGHIDALPMPSDRARLFELYVLTRILDRIAPHGSTCRWAGNVPDANWSFPIKYAVAGATVHYGQVSMKQDTVTKTLFGTWPESALKTFGISVKGLPTKPDIWIRVENGLLSNRYTDIVVECKSGEQTENDCAFQLLSYATTARQIRGEKGRILAIGVHESGMKISDPQLEFVCYQRDSDAPDVLAFARYDDLDKLMDHSLGDPSATPWSLPPPA